MKDLILTSADGTITHTFRTDLLANDGANFNILAIDPPKNTGNARAVDNISLYGHTFRNVNHSLNFMKTFCVANNLKMTIQDANGKNAAALVGYQSPAGTHVAILSATGSTKTILITGDVHTTFLTTNHLTIYNADFSIYQKVTINGNSTYSSPNTSVVVNEVIVDIPTASGKFIVNNG